MISGFRLQQLGILCGPNNTKAAWPSLVLICDINITRQTATVSLVESKNESGGVGLFTLKQTGDLIKPNLVFVIKTLNLE